MKKSINVWPLKNLLGDRLKPELKGPRIILKAPILEDYEEWSLVRTKNQEYLKPFEPEWAQDCLSLAFFIRRLERQNKQQREGRGCYFLIHHRENNHIIGGINLNDIQMGAARHASLGYWIDEDYQGKGYMKESAKAVIDYAFCSLKLRRLNAACLPHNTRSIELLKSVNFEEEGFAKKYLQINGKWQDHLLFGRVNPIE